MRVDAQTLDSPGFGGAACTRTIPSCNYGVNGPVQGQSLSMFTVSGGQVAVTQASLLVALDASASIKFFAAAATSGGFLPVTTGAPAVFSPITTPPTTGPNFRWQAQLAPDPISGVSSVSALQWQLQVK